MKIPGYIIYIFGLIAIFMIILIRLWFGISKRKKIADNPSDTIANNIKDYGNTVADSINNFLGEVFGCIGVIIYLALSIGIIILIVWCIKWLWFKLPIR